MNAQAASLQNLQDIAVPPAPGFWPPADGVWVVLVVALCLVLALTIRWWRKRARNAYRRAGLALLPDAGTARDVDVVLKRVALAAFPRPRVAPLYGDDWVTFLESTCGRSRFAPIAAADPSAPATSELRKLAGTWIRHHRTDEGGS